MREYFTNALVLDEEDSGELDKLVYLYTEELGRVVAKAKSARKITSKLAGHLQPLNFVKIRLVGEGGFQIADALTEERIEKSGETWALLQFIKEMTFELQPDKKLWATIKKTFQCFKEGKNFSYKPLLKVLGFATDFARCNTCGSKFVAYFSKSDQVFFCQRCGWKIPKNEIILIQ